MKYTSARVVGPVLVVGFVVAVAAAGPIIWGGSGTSPDVAPLATVGGPRSLAGEPHAATTTEPVATTEPAALPTTIATTAPTFVETSFGTVTVRETVVPLNGGDGSLTNPVVTPDGYALMTTTEQGVELWTSTDGSRWDREPVPDIFGEYPWIYTLIASGDSLLAIGRGPERGGAWLRTADGSWRDIDIYGSMAFEQDLLDWYFLDVFGSATVNGEFALVGGAVSDMNWSGMVDEWTHHGFEWDGEARQLIAYTDSGERRFDLDVRPATVGVSLTVHDASSGEMMYEGDVIVPGLSPEQTVEAILESGGHRVSVAAVTLRVGADGMVERGVGVGLEADVVMGFAANGRGSVVLGMDWISGPSPRSQVLVGPVDGPWVDATEAFALAEGSTVEGIAARPGQFLATGLRWGRAEISPSVFVTGPITAMWLSDDGSAWTELPVLSSSAGPGDVVVGGGDMGWAALTQSCITECTRFAWLSPDGDVWDEIPLLGSLGRSISMQLRGVAVGTDRVVAVAWSDTGEGGDMPRAVITVISLAG